MSFWERKRCFCLMTLACVSLCVSLCVLSAQRVLARSTDDQRVAVTELTNNAGIPQRVSLALTESVRGEVAELLGKRYLVMTKENILSLVEAAVCDEASEASCEVEMGRKLGAHFIISGALTKLGGKLKLSLKVHSTRDARLLGVREDSARDINGVERLLPRVARGASALIDKEVASRGDVLSAELEALQSEVGVSGDGSTGEGDDFEAQMRRLEQAEVERGEVKGGQSDEEYQRELKRIEREQAEREAHEREAEKDWSKVERVAQKSATKGEVAIRLFMKKYGSHRLGNPKASEAQRLLEEVQQRQLEERKERLRVAHFKVVKRAWAKAKRIVERGDEKGERALELFLKAYEDHPMGNPLAGEARAAFSEAQQARQAAREAQHLKRIKRDWSKAKRMVKRGDSRGERALELFLKKYEGHELGNPLADEARATFSEGKAERERAEREAHEVEVRREWSRIARVVKGGGKPAIKAVKLFLRRYERHPLGNPIEAEVRAMLDVLRSGGRSSGAVSAGSGKAGIAWVRIPGGSFMMGSDEGASNEKPVHSVRVRSFLMSKTEVTVGQYRRCVEAGRCTAPGTGYKCNWGESGREDHPINCVDWGQARTFAKWVGADVDLPTEAEWEYAARGGQRFNYAGSNDADEVAWYFSNSGRSTHSVGTKKANGFGLHDMSGNVWEWTLDEYKSFYSGAPSNGSQARGSVPTCRIRCDGGSARRVDRGGSWDDGAVRLRVAVRDDYSPVSRNYYLGFRLRRTLP